MWGSCCEPTVCRVVITRALSKNWQLICVLNFISIVFVTLTRCSSVKQPFNTASIWPLSAVACLQPASRWPCPTAFYGSWAFDSRIDCMYLYFTGGKKKISIESPKGSVAYQRPSQSLEREWVARSSVNKRKHRVNKVCRPGLLWYPIHLSIASAYWLLDGRDNVDTTLNVVLDIRHCVWIIVWRRFCFQRRSSGKKCTFYLQDIPLYLLPHTSSLFQPDRVIMEQESVLWELL